MLPLGINVLASREGDGGRLQDGTSQEPEGRALDGLGQTRHELNLEISHVMGHRKGIRDQVYWKIWRRHDHGPSHTLIPMEQAIVGLSVHQLVVEVLPLHGGCTDNHAVT